MNNLKIDEWRNIPENAFLYFPRGAYKFIQVRRSLWAIKKSSGEKYSKENRSIIHSKHRLWTNCRDDCKNKKLLLILGSIDLIN